jgi:parallel beta-helix repeat protein
MKKLLFLIVLFTSTIFAQTPAGRYAPSLTKINNDIYLFGGDDQNNRYNDLWKYSEASGVGVWTELFPTGDIPSPTTETAAVNYQNNLYIVGGLTDENANDRNAPLRIYKYSPSANEWSEITPTGGDIPKRMNYHIAEVIGDYIYANLREQLWRFNLLTSEWEELASPPAYSSTLYNFYGHNSVVYNNKLYIIRGGMSQEGKVHIYDPATNTWETKNPTTTSSVKEDGVTDDNIPPSTWGSNYWVDGDYAYSTGGREVNSRDILDEFWRLNIPTNTWEKLPDYSDQRYHGAAVKYSDSKVMIGGGRKTDDGSPENYKLIKINSPTTKVTLQTNVSPSEASADGCSVAPSGGKYNVGEIVTISATATTGWGFAEWSGGLSGTANPADLTMDSDKDVTAYFEALLILGFDSVPKKDIPPPESDKTEVTIGTTKLTAGGVDWKLYELKYDVLKPIKSIYTKAYIKYRGKFKQGTFTKDNDGNIINIKFKNIDEVIAEGTTLSVEFFYAFTFPKNKMNLVAPIDEIKELGISIKKSDVDCRPLADVLSSIIPSTVFKSETQTMATIWNGSYTPHIPFLSLQDAINDPRTVNGNNIEVWEGYYNNNEKIEVNKELVITGVGNRENIIFYRNSIPDNPYKHEIATLFINSNNTTLKHLFFYKSKLGVCIGSKKNVSILDSEFDKNELHLFGEKMIDVSIEDNIFKDIINSLSDPTVILNNSENLQIKGCTFTNSKGNNIELSGIFKNTIIQSNTFEGDDGYYAISLFEAQNVDVISNSFDGERSTAFIRLQKCSNHSIISNKIHFNKVVLLGSGVYITESQNLDIIDNIMIGVDKAGRGIEISNSNNVNIIGNNFKDFYLAGIEIKECREIVINNNYLKQNFRGIILEKVKNLTITKNRIKTALVGGITLVNSNNFNISENKITDVYYTLLARAIAIYLDNVSKGKVYGNSLFDNCTAIEIINSKDNSISVYGNNILHSLCFHTGINLDNFAGSILQNNLDNNNGTAISVKGTVLPNKIEQNNISNNEKAVINLTDKPLTVDNNYWGNPDGPGEDDLVGDVQFTDFLNSPISLVIAKASDTVVTAAQESDSVDILFQNYVTANDLVQVTVSDELGWVQNSGSTNINLIDSSYTAYAIKYSVPSNSSGVINNKVNISAVSLNNSEMTAVDSFYILNYSPELTSIVVTPDSLALAFGDSLKFRADLLDQYGKEYSGTSKLTWSSSAGTIDSTGYFFADSVTQVVTISVLENNSNLSASVDVNVNPHNNIATVLTIYPDSVQIYKNSFTQFYAEGKDEHGFKVEFGKEWLATGGTIDQSGLYTAGDVEGEYSVIVRDTISGAQVTAKVVVGFITDVERECIIPKEYSLNQNYPNPFNPSTTISYGLPYNSKVKVEVFNVLGQRVDVIANGVESAGVHSTLWNADNLASGIYIIRINAVSISNNRDYSKSIKMILLK